MATNPQRPGAITLIDFSKSLDPNGKVANTIELLAQTNEILTDMLWKEGNLPTGHRTSMRVGLPTAIWRQLYGGVPASKSVRATVDDATGMMEARSEVDIDLANLNGNASALRMSEAEGFLETMNQLFVQTLFYGDTTLNPERFMGLSPRYSLSSALNGQNIIKMGGSSNANNSIWLIGWGENTVCGIYPKASESGLQHWDLGEYDALDSSGYRFRVYGDRWQWKCGLTVPDWRYAVRICNIDQTAILADTTGGTIKIMEAMLKARARIPALGKCKPAFYMNRTLSEMLQIQAMNKSTNALSLAAAANQFGAGGEQGAFVTNFMGIPIRQTDALLPTEANVA